MKLLYISIFLLAVVSFVAANSTVKSKDRNKQPRKVVCYDSSWGNEHKTEETNLNVCTHLNLAFARLQNNTIHISDSKVFQARIIALRKIYPNLTMLISLGAGPEHLAAFSKLTQSEANRKVFIHSVLEFLKTNDLDGLDIDWEFPGFKDDGNGVRINGFAEDKQNFITLLKELKAAFASYGYLLTAALGNALDLIERGYDIASLSQLLDFINLMTYDFHGPWIPWTGHNSPLYPNPHQSEGERELTIQFVVDYFHSNGTDLGKIVLGMPLYGYVFQLANPNDTKLGAWVVKGSEAGTYAQICQKIKQPGWTQHWDKYAQVPYAVHGAEWLTFDNLASFQAKLNFILQRHLGGAMIWEVNGDDSL